MTVRKGQKASYVVFYKQIEVDACEEGENAPAHRCNRDLSGRFGTEVYAMEELVAELGATFLCAELGIATARL